MTKAGDLTIHAPWARASAGMARAGAAFMTITNTGAADRLISASADKGKRVELHTHIKEGEVMRMRQVPAIDVPAQGQVDLKPGSYHVMFMGLAAPFKEGETFPLTLTFEKAGDVTVTVSVKGAGAMGAGMKMKMEMGHDQMDHSKMPMMKKDN
ncbi:MAG: copper chaperone PCu(A)C [Rhodobacterales bacterium]|nr:copper chaperone PCu(A)C [Rhodobacterales bacterium]